MPYGYDPILTSFTSITTSSSDCSGEGTKRTYQGLWRMSDVEGRANIALRVARSVARPRQLHWLRVTRITPLTLYPEWIVQAARQRGWGGPPSAFARNHVRQSSLEHLGLRGEGLTPVPLPPPGWSTQCFLRATSLAVKSSKRGHLRSSLWTADRQDHPVILRKACSSPNLWRSGSRRPPTNN